MKLLGFWSILDGMAYDTKYDWKLTLFLEVTLLNHAYKSPRANAISAFGPKL